MNHPKFCKHVFRDSKRCLLCGWEPFCGHKKLSHAGCCDPDPNHSLPGHELPSGVEPAENAIRSAAKLPPVGVVTPEPAFPLTNDWEREKNFHSTTEENCTTRLPYTDPLMAFREIKRWREMQAQTYSDGSDVKRFVG